MGQNHMSHPRKMGAVSQGHSQTHRLRYPSHSWLSDSADVILKLHHVKQPLSLVAVPNFHNSQKNLCKQNTYTEIETKEQYILKQWLVIWGIFVIIQGEGGMSRRLPFPWPWHWWQRRFRGKSFTFTSCQIWFLGVCLSELLHSWCYLTALSSVGNKGSPNFEIF